MGKTRTILGVNFLIDDAAGVVAAGLRGGLVVVPSAPVLVAMESSEALRDALVDADQAVTDSGLMVLLWRIFQGEKITRVSGLEYLQLLLADSSFKQPNAIFWVMPNLPARDRLLVWLKSVGIPLSPEQCYIAPHYGDGRLNDPALLTMIQYQRPTHIIMGVGGGVQERLGHYLKHSLDYRPAIHCIGGAIGFLTGDQVRIPRWADYLYLGWLCRSISAPSKFIPRYWRARRLIGLMWRYGDRLPSLTGRLS